MFVRRPPPKSRVLGAILALALTGCVSPFHDHQSAAIVPTGETELTFGYSRPMVHDDEDGFEKVHDDFGVQIATGAAGNTEFRARYEYVSVGDANFHVVAAGPKIGLVPGKVALYVPFGSAFGEDTDFAEMFSTHPTLIVSRQLSPEVELNVSGKGLIYFDEISESDVAFNLGLALGSPESQLRIRPEVGVLFDTEEWDRIWQFGVGLSLRPGSGN